jgi:hypothetical protein
MQPFTNKFAMPKAALGLAACLVLAGCNSYSHMTRSDKISPAAGDAVYAARTMQTVDPWPEYVLDTDIQWTVSWPTSGQPTTRPATPSHWKQSAQAVATRRNHKPRFEFHGIVA